MKRKTHSENSPARKSKHASLAMSALVALGLASCGGGGGGAGGAGAGGGGQYNQGSYDKDAFEYEDPYAAEFHPLQSVDFRASRRDETVFSASTKSSSIHATAHDDVDAKRTPLSLFSNSLFESGFSPRDSMAGALDAERGDEIAYLGARGTELEIVTLTANENGTWKRSGKFAVQGSALGFRQLELELVDVDADGIDEFVVAATYAGSVGGFVRVYDDASGGNRLMKNLDVAGCYFLQAVAFDADADGKPELLLMSRESSTALVALLGRADDDFALRHDWSAIDRYARRVVVGDFDADHGDEFGVVTYGNAGMYAITYDLNKDGVTKIDSAKLFGSSSPIDEAVAVDTNRDGKHEILAATRIYDSTNRRYYGYLAHWATRVDAGPRKERLQTIRWSNYTRKLRMAVHDGNADGREEIAISTLLERSSTSKTLYKHVVYPSVDKDGNFSLAYSYLGGATVPGATDEVTAAAGDFDRENLVLRSTGKKWLDLPDPMPIAVMAAPPTKASIAQNYDNSSTEYGTEQSTERSHGVTTGWSASFSTGFEASDLFDTFGVSAKQTIASSMAKTLTNSHKVTWTKTFAGSYDKDVVIFQGTLYQIYEYEIVSAQDEKLVGSKITLNDPVATKTYKWTVDFYNESVKPEARIPEAVLSHTVGEPRTYMRPDAAKLLLRSSLGWMDEGLEVGAVRGGSNSTSVTISDANTSETSRSFSVTWEAEVKIGGATIGGSFGLDSEQVYGVTVEKGTTYAGSVGDIEDTDQWQDWRYSFGLLVHRYGADESGAPRKGMRPYHVINYWVDDLGPAHLR